VIREARVARREQAAERGRALECHGEVALEQSAQDLIGERHDLVWPGGNRRARNDGVDRGGGVTAPLEEKADRIRVLADERAQQIDAPERTRQAARARLRPEFRDGVDAVLVGEGDEAIDHPGVTTVLHAPEQRLRGVVRDAARVCGVLAALERLELGRRRTGWACGTGL